MRAHRVAMALTPGMPIFEAAVPCMIFGVDRSHVVSPWYEFSILGIGDGPVPLLPGFHFHQTAPNSDLQRADTLIVPACLDVHEAPPPELVDVVRSAYRRGTRILSICSGAFVLAAAGILDGAGPPRTGCRRTRPPLPSRDGRPDGALHRGRQRHHLRRHRGRH
ncbi:DJ-1/PfpI family protein [Dactylosporangium sp. NPDC000555]|uniref:DJ-1/PfpI family protein n=1 Tax=Dactylosporangium sp. NPDC000555 TaxID=3154260 RepID=UPI00333021A1